MSKELEKSIKKNTISKSKNSITSKNKIPKKVANNSFKTIDFSTNSSFLDGPSIFEKFDINIIDIEAENKEISKNSRNDNNNNIQNNNNNNNNNDSKNNVFQEIIFENKNIVENKKNNIQLYENIDTPNIIQKYRLEPSDKKVIVDYINETLSIKNNFSNNQFFNYSMSPNALVNEIGINDISIVDINLNNLNVDNINIDRNAIYNIINTIYTEDDTDNVENDVNNIIKNSSKNNIKNQNIKIDKNSPVSEFLNAINLISNLISDIENCEDNTIYLNSKKDNS